MNTFSYQECPCQRDLCTRAVRTAKVHWLTTAIVLEWPPCCATGTDGLWDNCYLPEIISLLPKDASETQAAADMVAATARKHAGDQEFASPYTREALSQG